MTIDKRKITGFAIDQAMLANFNPTAWEGKAELNVMELADTIAADVISVVTKSQLRRCRQRQDRHSAGGVQPGLAIAQIRAHIVKNKMSPTRCTLALNPDYAALLAIWMPTSWRPRGNQNGAIPWSVRIPSALSVKFRRWIPGFINQPDSVAMGSRKVPVGPTPLPIRRSSA